MNVLAALIISFLLSASIPAQQPALSVEDKNQDSIVREANILALQFYALLKEGKDNTVLSPYGISASMALPFAGSEGSTESQMARVMRFRISQPQVHDVFKRLYERLADSPYFLSSSLWVQKGSVKPEFKTTIEGSYGASLRLVDFITRPEGVRVEMNSWIRERTQGKITGIVSTNDITNNTRMVVLSGAYLKGRWQQTFDSRSTAQMPFFSDRYSTSTVPTMTMTGEFNYLEDKKFSLVEIPYDIKKPAADKLSLLIFLPHETYGLKSVEAELTADNLQGWLKDMRKQLLVLNLPRFRVADTYSLEGGFIKMALSDPFKDGANFTGIRDVSDLKISKVMHSAAYSVDEWGSEGGVAYGASNELNGASQIALSFLVNHPFMFMVIDRDTSSILLVGRVVSP